MKPDDHEMVRLWIFAGGLEGPRALPQEGGLLDQAAVMMDAFAVCRSTASRWLEEKRKDES